MPKGGARVSGQTLKRRKMCTAAGKTRRVRPTTFATYKNLVESQGPRRLRPSTYKKISESENMRILRARIDEERKIRIAQQAAMRREIANLGSLMESMMSSSPKTRPNNTTMAHTKPY